MVHDKLSSSSGPHTEPELTMYSIELRFGSSDTGAPGYAVSKHSLEFLHNEEPDSFSALDTDRRKVVVFGGGAKTYNLGMR